MGGKLKEKLGQDEERKRNTEREVKEIKVEEKKGVNKTDFQRS